MANETNTPPGASISDIVAALNAMSRNSSLLSQTMSAVLPRVTGSFTLSGSANTTVSQVAVAANSVISWIPTNSAAGTVVGSAASIFQSALNAGSGFVVTTANGAATGAGATFTYWIWNPS
jgi:hypothetical protein